MNEVKRCPTCGNVLSGDLDGRCPECMLQAGLASSSRLPADQATVDYPTRADAAAPASIPCAGQEFGEYHLVRPLGKGGMGTVFEAEDRATGRRLALKVLSHSLDSPTARQRFLREGRLAASVNHPHSVYVFGTEEIGGAPVITMELVKGGTLQDELRRRGPLPIAAAVDAILQVIDGLEAARAVGVLHRDVKPSNCFVDAEGHVKIGDFGLSISKIGRGELQLSNRGEFLGTPTFASPEQLRGDELDERSDLYAVGVTLYNLLTGQVPFAAEQMVQLVATVLEKPAPAVRALRPETPRDLALLVQRCLEKEPGRRYRSYADLRAALLPFSSLVPVPASLAWRIAAGLIDFAILALLMRVLGIVLGLLEVGPTFRPRMGRQLYEIALGVGVWFLYYILPEGLTGVSPGKWLLRLRVARKGTMYPPGVGRSAVRTLFYKLFPSTLVLLYAWNDRAFVIDGAIDLTDLRIWAALLVELTALPLWALLFITMRRSNGFAAIHDLLSGTRVIFRPWSVARPVTTLAALAADRVEPGPAQVGPYHLLARLGSNDAGEWHLGYDTRLLRKVWVRVVPEGTPPVSGTIRDQTRSGRLRWLTGRRGPTASWDAFEAPGGEALWTLLDRPHDWGEVRYWLLDLSEELAFALRDGTLPAALGLDRVWITAEGRAKLLDLPAPGLDARPASTPTEAGDVAPVRGFLRQVGAAGLRGRPLAFDEAQQEAFAFPLPLHARPIVDGLTKVQHPEVLHTQIRGTLDKPTRVTRVRRLAPLTVCVAVLVGLAILVGAKHLQTLVGLAEFPDALDFQEALDRHTPSLGFDTPPTAEEKSALEIYIAGRYGKRMQEPAFWKNPYLATRIMPTHQQIAMEIVERTPTPSAEALTQATALLYPDGDANDELEASVPVLALLAMMFGADLVLLIALPAILAALLFRGGILWHLFGIVAVTADGHRARRWRVTLRSLFAWSPLFLLPVAMFLPWAESDTFMLLVALVALSLLLASAFSERSWADRLAGTWLVIR